MDGNEEVGLVAVGDMGALGERDIHIGGAGIDNLHIGVVIGDKFAKFLGDREDDSLLRRLATNGTRFVAAVARVNDYRAHLVSVFFL